MLQPAKITGYHCNYPALLDGPCNAKGEGVAFEIESAEHVRLLQNYETEHYRKAACLIQLMDGSTVRGATFMWHSNVEELHEGVFGLKDFQIKQLEMDSIAKRRSREGRFLE